MKSTKQPQLSEIKWPFLISGIVLAGIFTVHGTYRLVLSYSLNNPLEFIVLFFSSSMVLLIGGTIFIVLFLLAIAKVRCRETPSHRGEGLEEEE
ncbi:MAG: hypothetical protein JXD19_12645 [Deltaproteobacteria bacterium]|nr:hypothetical protein [Deltaproteobacteria bacterium]